MGELYSISPEDDVATIRVEQGATLADMKRAVEAVAPYERRMWVVQHLEASRQEMQILAEHLKGQPVKPARVAIVAASDLAFGLARMFEVFREDQGVNTKTFRGEAEALAWLRAE